MISISWRRLFRRKGALQINVRDLSTPTQDLILEYDAVLDAYEGKQQILTSGHEYILTDDADDRIAKILSDTAIALSLVPEPVVAALGDIVCLMWTDPEYCWTKDHEASKRLSQLATDVQNARADEARLRAERLYAPYKALAANQKRPTRARK